MSTPAVSVVVPTYNRGALLLQALHSVAEQDLDADVELVVVDNASTDDTEAVVEEFSRSIRPVVYRRWDTNLGPVENWRRGIELASSSWVKILWSDDRLLPTALRVLLRAAEETGCSVVTARARVELPSQTFELYTEERLLLDASTVSRGLLALGPELPVSPATGLVRREHALAGLAIIPFEPLCRAKAIGPDVALYYWGIFTGHSGVHVPEVLSVLVGSDDSITQTSPISLLSTCYAGTLLRLAEVAGADLPRDVRVAAAHTCALGRLRRVPTEAVHPDARLSLQCLARSALRKGKRLL